MTCLEAYAVLYAKFALSIALLIVIAFYLLWKFSPAKEIDWNQLKNHK